MAPVFREKETLSWELYINLLCNPIQSGTSYHFPILQTGPEKIKNFVKFAHHHKARDWGAEVQYQDYPIPESTCLPKKNKQSPDVQKCKTHKTRHLLFPLAGGWQSGEGGWRDRAGRVKGEPDYRCCIQLGGLYTVARGNQWRFPIEYCDKGFILGFRLWIMSYILQSEIIKNQKFE